LQSNPIRLDQSENRTLRRSTLSSSGVVSLEQFVLKHREILIHQHLYER
jgi:hypothetical protein